MPVRAEITGGGVGDCTVTLVSFAVSGVKTNFVLGGGPQTYKLPAIQQTPDCGRDDLNSIVIKEVEGGLKREDVTLDLDAQTVTVKSTDFLMLGKTATVMIEVETDPEEL